MRFAPSPTGFLHVGGARTALFNWLFARHHGGTFILRVEDTDAARYDPRFVKGIFDALRWLRIDWDEGPDVGGPHAPYVQSERAAIHRAAAARLLADGNAYECYCAKAPAAQPDDDADGDPPAAAEAPSCACRALDDDGRARARAQGRPPALRFATDPSRAVTVDDLVRGPVTFPAGTIGDFIFVKSDGTPLYNFAATCDDHVMEITHVIRGEEHLANAPKQLLLYEALGWTPPAMAHIPIILNEQRRKLSKRDGATFVNDYEAMGYLPDALVNFLALLGWSPGDDRELMTVDEMIRDFRLEDVVKHPAIFDVAKLSWMNKEYLRRLTPAQAAAKLRALIPSRLPHADRTDAAHVERVAALLADRVQTLAQMLDQGAYFFTYGPVYPTPEALAKHCSAPDAVERLAAARHALEEAPAFDPPGIEAAIRRLADTSGAKAASFIHPLRVALTGQAVSPGIFEVTSILGREVALRRIDALMERLRADKPVATEPTTR